MWCKNLNGCGGVFCLKTKKSIPKWDGFLNKTVYLEEFYFRMTRLE